MAKELPSYGDGKCVETVAIRVRRHRNYVRLRIHVTAKWRFDKQLLKVTDKMFGDFLDD